MRNGLLGSLIVVLTCAGPTWAQMPYSYSYPYPYAQPYRYAAPYPYGGYYPTNPYQSYAPNYATPRQYMAVPMSSPGGYTPAYQQPYLPAVQPQQQAPAQLQQPYTTAYRSPKVLGWPPPGDAPPADGVIVDTPAGPCANGTCAGGACAGGACADGLCQTCPAPAPPPHAPQSYHCYGSAEVLYWRINRDQTPPLLSTGPLGVPGNVLLLNDLDFDNRYRLGGRFTLGAWLDPSQTCGIETTFLFLQQRNPSFTATSATDTLAVPFHDAVTGANSAFLLGVPGTSLGTATLRESSTLWSGEVNFRHQLCRCACAHLDVLTGVRALQFNESLNLSTQSTGSVGGLFLGPTTTTADNFATQNLFLGGQVGLAGEVNYGRWFLNGWTKIGMGNIQERVNIGGTTAVTALGGAGSVFPGGIFAQPSNIGNYTRNEFAVLTDASFNLGYRITDYLRIFAGYSVLYVNRTVRPGAQIDTTINTTQTQGGTLAGSPHPSFNFMEHSFWAQGVSAGLEFRY